MAKENPRASSGATALARSKGRPRLEPGAVKRHPVGIRTTKELKDRLIEASKASGRSLAQEIELRLQRSFDADDALGGPHSAAFLRAFGEAAGSWSKNFLTIDGKPGPDDWATHYETLTLAANKMTDFVKTFLPAPPHAIQQRINDGRTAILALNSTDAGTHLMAKNVVYLLAHHPSLPEDIRAEFRNALPPELR